MDISTWNITMSNYLPLQIIYLVWYNALEKRLEKNDITFILDHADEMSEENLSKLSKFENCVIYPPIAYISEEAKKNKQEIFIGNLSAFLEGKVQNRVNWN